MLITVFFNFFINDLSSALDNTANKENSTENPTDVDTLLFLDDL